MLRARKLFRDFVQLAAAVLVVGGFFIPNISMPFVPPVSLFELLTGNFSGGGWRPARLVLLVIFAAALVFLGAAVHRLLRPRHESTAV